MDKSYLRQEYLRRRKDLTEADYQQRNRQLATQLFASYDFNKALVIHCFLPSTQQREVDTWPIIQRLWQSDKVQIAAPRCGENYSLTHHRITPDTTLAHNRWGIPEPLSESPSYDPTAIDVVLVPLLAFDRHGHRVGYGKGFYDRFLRACRADTQMIGLSLFPPVDQIVDVSADDVPLDAVVTPNKVYSFR